MVARLTTILALFFCARASSGATPDLSHAAPAALHQYVGTVAQVTGHISLGGKYGVLVDTGKVQIYILSSMGAVDPGLHKQRVVVRGTLRFVPEFTIANPSRRLGPLFFFGDDCTIHYPSPWPHEPSNPAMQPTQHFEDVREVALLIYKVLGG